MCVCSSDGLLSFIRQSYRSLQTTSSVCERRSSQHDFSIFKLVWRTGNVTEITRISMRFPINKSNRSCSVDFKWMAESPAQDKSSSAHENLWKNVAERIIFRSWKMKCQLGRFSWLLIFSTVGHSFEFCLCVNNEYSKTETTTAEFNGCSADANCRRISSTEWFFYPFFNKSEIKSGSLFVLLVVGLLGVARIKLSTL